MVRCSSPTVGSAALAVALCAASIIATGCAHAPSDPRAKSIVVIAVDRTVSGTSARETQVTQLDSLLKSAVEAHYSVDVWTYDSGAQHLWGPGVLTSDDQLDPLIQQQLAPVAFGLKRTGRADLLVSAVAGEPGIAAFQSARVFLLTDGVTAPALRSPKTIDGLATVLSKHGNWRLAVLDISAGNRLAWVKALAPLGGRCEFLDERETTKMLSQNRDM